MSLITVRPKNDHIGRIMQESLTLKSMIERAEKADIPDEKSRALLTLQAEKMKEYLSVLEERIAYEKSKG
jgi:hypothetical protein